MQNFGRISDGANHRRAIDPVTRHHHETPGATRRAGPEDRDGWDAKASGTLRKDLSAFRAAQIERLAARDDAPPRRPGRRGATHVANLSGVAGRIELADALFALVPTRLLLELAFPAGAAAALVMFWSTFGPSFVAALMNQPVPQ